MPRRWASSISFRTAASSGSLLDRGDRGQGRGGPQTGYSFYIHDPEGNTCEVYRETGRRSGGGVRPIDLAKSEEELLELIRA